jgi:hypothetical protein
VGWDVVEFVRRQRAAVIAVGVVIALIGVLGLVLDWGGSSTSTAAPKSKAKSGSSTSSPSAASSSVAEETPEEFFALFTTAVKNGDTAFLAARAHPAVIERYGEAQCAAFMTNLVDPTVNLHLVSVSKPENFDYASDGKSTIIPDTITFHVDGSNSSSSGPRDFHYARVEGKFRIFVDCGDPQ